MRLRKVLIIDDEKEFCEVVRMYLEMTLKSNFQVSIAYDGKEGVKLAKAIRPDLILLDIVMPIMDGFKVLEQLKRDPATMSIPVVMLSAKVDAEAKLRALQLYNDEYITKPVAMLALKAKVEEILKRRGIE
ncbi:MAG: response regulator [Candidatus Omnitrophica bacterium]|nr:response regulator [Candidatus Omnitrophota bacterium]